MSDKIDIAKKVITISTDCLAVGGFAFKVFADQLGVIAAVGTVVKDVLDLRDEQKPVLEKLGELDKQIGLLSDKMSGQFNDLKVFMSEHYFYAELAQTALTLIKYMQDTLAHPGPQSIGLFRDATLRTQPLSYGYRLISLLEQDSTNTLKLAMDADWMRKTATFDKWRNIIDGVLGQFLFLETYLNGMFWDSNMYGPNQLKDRIQELSNKMDGWRDEYKSSYWPDTVRKIVEDVQDQNENTANESRANILVEKLSCVLTDDAFFIIVYNDCAGYNNHSFNGFDNQTLYSYHRGNCNVVVYRSLFWNQVDRSELDRLSQEVEACRQGVIPVRKYYEDVPGELWNTRFHEVGFVGMIKKKKDVVVRSAKSFNDRPQGPGWWITAQSKKKVFILIVGYK